MATTSDKRREVAQRLREADAERSVPHPIEWYEEHGTADLFATLNACLGTCGLADEMRHPLARLADLIDPTCEDFGGQEGTGCRVTGEEP